MLYNKCPSRVHYQVFSNQVRREMKPPIQAEMCQVLITKKYYNSKIIDQAMADDRGGIFDSVQFDCKICFDAVMVILSDDEQ